MARQAKTPYEEVDWDLVAVDIVQVKLSLTEILEKYNIAQQVLYRYCEEAGIDTAKRNARYRDNRLLNQVKATVGKRIDQFKEDMQDLTITGPELMAMYGITEHGLHRFLILLGVDPDERRRKVRELGKTHHKGGRPKSSNIPESMSRDGKSMEWLTRPWKLAA